MADIFTIIGVVVIVFGALLFVSWFAGYIGDKYNWELLAWFVSVIISTAIISACILCHILKMS